tara:strand:- start:927 stop:1253 length:327 start_codon:yes stop_codon:yes gene_type:complete
VSRALRRAQERADKKQKKAAKEQTGNMPTTSSVAPNKGQGSEPKRKGSILKPRWVIDTWTELTKVTWPPRKDIGHLTYVVVLVSLVFGVILGLADLIFNWFVERIIIG